jgi:Rrf2 family protein
MRISTKGQHALRVMLDFAGHMNEGYIRLKDVAERQGVSKAYLEQIMILLNKSDFFNTSRGHQGGYKLAKRPDQYTVGDILRLTEGSVAPAACLEKDGTEQCDRRYGCMAFEVWKGLERVITEYLDGMTLQDILDSNRENAGFDFYI